MKKNFLNIFGIIIFIFVILLSVGYASFNRDLTVDEITAMVRLNQDVRISNLVVHETSYDGSIDSYVDSVEDYNKKSINGTINLPLSTSYITYEVEILVLGSIEYGLYQISNIPDNLSLTIDSDYNLKDKLCDSNNNCNLGIYKKIYLTLGYKDGYYDSSNTEIPFNLLFDFRKYYNISYNDLDTTKLPTEIIDGGTLDITFNENVTNVTISIDNVLINPTKYTLSNNRLVLNNIQGDVIINNASSTKIIPIGTNLYYNPVMGLQCNNYVSSNSQMGVTEGCLKWNVISDDGTTIRLLLDHNIDKTTNANDYQWSSSVNINGPDNLYSLLINYTSLWKNTSIIPDSDTYTISSQSGNNVSYTLNYNADGAKARFITAEEISEITNNSFDISTTSVNSRFDANKFSWLSQNLMESQDNYGTYGYWTSSSVAGFSDKAWSVTNDNFLSSNRVDQNVLGIRPVIVINSSVFDTLYNILINNSNDSNTQSDYVTSSDGIIFSNNSSVTNGQGLYILSETKDDENPVSFYRGNVKNNNIIFNDICWKIVRTTSTGGVKILYNGLPSATGTCNNVKNTTAFLSNKIKFNTRENNAKYVGYYYTTTEIDDTPSNIAAFINDWYANNLLSVDEYIEDTVWCNDRTITETSADGKIFYYGSYTRLKNSTPSLKCSPEDSFTVDLANGNGKLTYKIGLLTSDEVILAGQSNLNTENKDYFLFVDARAKFWLSSPAYYDGGKDFVLTFRDKGKIAPVEVIKAGEGGVRPAISLIPGITFKSGDGSINNPYIVNIGN